MSPDHAAELALIDAEAAVCAEALRLARARLAMLERIQELGRTVDPQPGESIGDVLDRLEGPAWLEARELVHALTGVLD